MMKLIDKNLLAQLSSAAKDSSRQRAIHCFHEGDADLMHRMLNALEPTTYVQPHKHPDKCEAFIILKGSILFVIFDEKGNIIKHEILAAGADCLGLEIPPQTYHTLIALEEGTVIFEIKHGPYNALTDKVFAAWSPKEGEEGCQLFNQNILQTLR